MNGTSRPLDSGRKDALGRTVRVSEQDTESRADAPTPHRYNDRYDGQPTSQVARAVRSAVAQLPGNIRVLSDMWVDGRYLIDIGADPDDLDEPAEQLTNIGFATRPAGVWLEIESVRPNNIHLLLNTTDPSGDDFAIDHLGNSEGLTLRVMTADEWTDDQINAAIETLERSDRADVRAVRDSIRDARDAQRGWGNLGAQQYLAEGQVAAGLRTRESLARFRKRCDVLHYIQQWEHIDTGTLRDRLVELDTQMASGGLEPLDRTKPFPPSTTEPGQGLRLQHAALSAYLHEREQPPTLT